MLSLSACGALNAGDAGSASFEKEFAGDPDIAELRVGGSNVLPWAGTVRGTVVAQDGLSDAELGALVDRIGAYTLGSPSNISVTVEVSADGVLFPVHATRPSNAELGDLVSEVRSDDRIIAADLGAGNGGRADLDFTVAESASVFEVAATHAGDAERLGLTGELPGNPRITVGTVDGTVSIHGPGVDASARAQDWVKAAERVWRELSGAVDLATFEFDQESFEGAQAGSALIEVMVSQDSEVEVAAELITSARPGPEIEFKVSSTQFELDPEAAGDGARKLIGQLDADVQALVLSTWTDDDVAQLTLGAASDVAAVADAVEAAPDAANFSTIALFVEGPGSTGGSDSTGNAGAGGDSETPGGSADRMLAVFAAPNDLVESSVRAIDLLSAPDVTKVSLARDRVEATSAQPAEMLASLAEPLKRAARAGDWVCAYGADSVNVLCLTAASTVDIDTVGNEDHPSRAAFVAAWNAAPALDD